MKLSDLLGGWTFDGASSASIVSDQIDGGAGTKGQGKGDPRVAITGGGVLSQNVRVEHGKTYTFSVWAYSPEGQDITLRAASGSSVLASATLPGMTSSYTVKIKPSKYIGTHWQRMRLEGVTISEEIRAITLSVKIAGGQTAYEDDFRSWLWRDDFGGGKPAPETSKYYYYEDFENLDKK